MTPLCSRDIILRTVFYAIMNFRPNKRLGQSFLIDQRAIQKVIKTADLHKDETVLEVGPGLGALTQELVKQAGKVIAVEKDRRLAAKLKETLKDCSNVEIITGDVLGILKGRALKNTALAKAVLFKARPLGYKIVSNIPYYLTSPLIRMFLESDNLPQEMVLVIQKEVAQRICASPPKMNLLAVSVQFYAEPEIISYVPKESFRPQPTVDSAILKIAQIKKPGGIDIEKFFKVVKAGFFHPRKQLKNNLYKGLNIDKEEINHHTKDFGVVIKRALVECGLPPQARAQNLSVEDWQGLSLRIASLTK
jgi:16S rRNA (adenine1518-N6/adenine1519-N6)-dimethyltransferase